MPNDGLGSFSFSEVNIYNISRLQIGMQEAEVLRIMKSPLDNKMFYINHDTYNVWFYVTKPVVGGQSRMLPVNLTPLVFKNGFFIGKGYAYYNYLEQLYERLESSKVLVNSDIKK